MQDREGWGLYKLRWSVIRTNDQSISKQLNKHRFRYGYTYGMGAETPRKVERSEKNSL